MAAPLICSGRLGTTQTGARASIAPTRGICSPTVPPAAGVPSPTASDLASRVPEDGRIWETGRVRGGDTGVGTLPRLSDVTKARWHGWPQPPWPPCPCPLRPLPRAALPAEGTEGFRPQLPGAARLRLWQRPQPGRNVPIKQLLLISRGWGNSLCRESVALCYAPCFYNQHRPSRGSAGTRPSPRPVAPCLVPASTVTEGLAGGGGGTPCLAKNNPCTPPLLEVWRYLNISSAYRHHGCGLGGSPAHPGLAFAFSAAGCIASGVLGSSRLGWGADRVRPCLYRCQHVRDPPALRDPQRSSLLPQGAPAIPWGLVLTRWEGAGDTPVPCELSLPPFPTTTGGTGLACHSSHGLGHASPSSSSSSSLRCCSSEIHAPVHWVTHLKNLHSPLLSCQVGRGDGQRSPSGTVQVSCALQGQR